MNFFWENYQESSKPERAKGKEVYRNRGAYGSGMKIIPWMETMHCQRLDVLEFHFSYSADACHVPSNDRHTWETRKKFRICKITGTAWLTKTACPSRPE